MNIFDKIFGKKVDLGEIVNFQTPCKPKAIDSYYSLNTYRGTFRLKYYSHVEKDRYFMEFIREDLPGHYKSKISRINITKKHI